MGGCDNMEITKAYAKDIKLITNQIYNENRGKDKCDFARVEEYIQQNYSRYDLSLEEVARYTNLTKTYMSALFRKETGIRYIDYLNKCRMEAASKLLTETDINIKDVAEACGYCNIPGFRIKFKDYYGVSASDYRKQNKAIK